MISTCGSWISAVARVPKHSDLEPGSELVAGNGSTEAGDGEFGLIALFEAAALRTRRRVGAGGVPAIPVESAERPGTPAHHAHPVHDAAETREVEPMQ